MLQPVKAGLGAFLSGYYSTLAPTTKPLNEYTTRGFDKAMVWAPGRMIDAVEQMLESWQKNDNFNTTTGPARLPVIIACMEKDFAPTARDFTRQVAQSELITLPDDPKSRVFGLRTVAGDIRTQFAFCAADEPTAKSLAAQFALFLDSPGNRRFTARYEFAGLADDWWVQIESPDVQARSVQTDAHNLTLLTLDIILKASIPLFDAPKGVDPHDDKGAPGTNDPAGYPVVVRVNFDSVPGPVDPSYVGENP